MIKIIDFFSSLQKNRIEYPLYMWACFAAVVHMIRSEYSLKYFKTENQNKIRKDLIYSNYKSNFC